MTVVNVRSLPISEGAFAVLPTPSNLPQTAEPLTPPRLLDLAELIWMADHRRFSQEI